MKIRTATGDDIEQLTLLKNPQKDHHKKMFHNNQIKRLKDMENKEAIYLAVEDNGKIIAHLLLKLNGIPTEPGYPSMNDLYVVSDRRGAGVGTKLIQQAETIAKKAGHTKISLAVNPTLNPKAQALYERLGYRQTKTVPYLDGIYDGDEDWVVDMVKELS